MQLRSRRMVLAVADALFAVEDEGHATRAVRTEALVDEVLAFVAAASFASRVTLFAALFLVRLAPLLLFRSFRPLERLRRGERQQTLAMVERTPLRFALLGWRTLLILHFYEDAKELARIGYRDERKRHLAVLPAVPAIPQAATSGVRLREDVPELDALENGKKGAA